MDVLAFVKAILADLSCAEFKTSGRSVAALSRALPPTAGSPYSLPFVHRHAVPVVAASVFSAPPGAIELAS